jgi:predicted NBD/HSP70 family sugar kinase
MYIGVDVGGTKTLVCILNEKGKITHSVKFPTPKNYEHFLLEMRNTAHHLPHQEFKAGGAGMPVTVFDRDKGIGRRFGNLPWRDVPLQHDLERLFHCPFSVDNDAKLAALSEALLLKKKYSKVLYVTVSTGIGVGFVNDGVIDENVGDGGGRAMLIEHKGKRVPWESFASGKAIVERYGKRASDIKDDATWKKIVRDLAPGLLELIAITQPEVIVFGGGVGTYFKRYHKLLAAELLSYEMPLIKLPELRGAERAEEAVIYGCYDLAKQNYDHADSHR